MPGLPATDRAPRWSVVLPTHDAPDTLSVSIASVLAQTDDDFELLVIGDGIADATRASVAGFDDARIQLLDLPKAAGYGYAHRASAIRSARGRDLAFASDDDLWAPDHLERLGVLLSAGVALAHSRSTWLLPDGHLVPIPFDLSDPALRPRFERGNYIPSTCFVATRTAVVVVSGVTTANVAVKVGLKTQRVSGSRIRLTGATWPDVPAGRASLQRQSRSGRWGPVARTNLSPLPGGRSRYSFVVRKRSRAMNYRVVVVPNDGGAHVSGHSRVVAVRSR